MARPKKSAKASRSNGAKASNKGKAKETVPVLTIAYMQPGAVTEVVTQQRAKLPKGYVAYESELSVHNVCIDEQVRARRDTAKDMSVDDRRRELLAAHEESLKMAMETRDWDVAKKISKLKEITKGTTSAFSFEERAAKQPRDRPRRVRFSV